MNSYKRYGRAASIPVVVTVLLSMLLTACVAPAASAPTSAPAPAASAPTSAPAPAASAPTSAPAPTSALTTTQAVTPTQNLAYAGATVSVLMDDRTQNHKLQAMLPEFEKATGIKVNLDIMPEGPLVEKENLELSQSVGTYDVMQYISQFDVTWAKNSWLTDLGPLADNPKLRIFGFDINNYAPGLVSLGTREGKLVGVNLIGSTGYMFYNQALLDKYGVKVPTNMDEFFAAAQQCTHPADGVYGFAARGERSGTQNFLNWMEFVKAYDGKLFDDKWVVHLTDAEAVKGTEMFVKAMQSYAPKSTLTAGWTEVQTMFQQGQVCMIWETNDMLSRLNDPSQSKVVGHVGTAVLPAAKEKHNAFLSSWAMGIPSTSKNKEAAFMFIEWATSTDIGLRAGYASTKDAIGKQYEAFPNPSGQPKIGDVIAEGFSYADPDFFPRVPEYFEWSEALAVEISNAITLQKTPLQANTDGAKAVEDVMRKAGYYK